MYESAVAVHSAFDEVEDEFHRVMEVSLNPRGPESLYDLVASLELPPGSVVVDVGCGRGEQAVELAERFGFDVLGIDPVPRYDIRAEAIPEPFRRLRGTCHPRHDHVLLAHRAVFDVVDHRVR